MYVQKLCPRCNVNRPRQRGKYCCACHAAYMREWRKTHKLSEEARRKDNARSYANVYKRRGKLIQDPCEVCGSKDSQMHHDDYSKPLEVRWFCRRHHGYLHNPLP